MREQMRKVLFISGSAHRLGGLATWLDYLLPGLADRGWQPVLGLVEGPLYHRPDLYLEDHPYDDWVPIPCHTGTPEGRCRAVLHAIHDVVPDLVVSVNIPDVYPATARARYDGLPVRALMTIHGIQPQLFHDALRFRALLDGAAATNRLGCVLLKELSGIDSERLHYAPYGFDVAETFPYKADAKLRIGYVGRLEQDQKRVLDLPRVSASLHDRGVEHEIWIAGEGAAASDLRNHIASDKAVFLGHVDQEALREVYSQIDALLILSEWETGPLVAWEAMANGVPVVTSRYLGSGLESALRDGENALLFEVGDAAGAADRLTDLFGDSALRSRVRNGGFELLRGRYSRVSSIEAWERCFNKVLDSPTVPPVKHQVPQASGRLDAWLGPRVAEAARVLLGRRGPDSGSAGEWPHTYGSVSDRKEFLQLAWELDSRVKSECSRR